MSAVLASSQKPRILILGPLPPPLMGPTIATRILINSKLKDSFTIIHLNTNTHKELSSLGKFRVTNVLRNMWVYCKMLWLICRRWPSIVLVPISQTSIGFLKDSIFIWLSSLFRRPTVIQLRGSNIKVWFDSCSKWWQLYINTVLSLTQAVIVLGNKLRYLFSDFYPSDKIFVVPNGLNIELPCIPPKSNDKLNLLYLGNLQPSKGIEDILRSIVLIRDYMNTQNVALDVIGDWTDENQRKKLMGLCRSEAIPVTFIPAKDGREKYEYLVRSDLFLFTPRTPEGHPWVIIEAMAAGLPIISTDQGAITESVIDGVNGFIVEKNNPQQIAEKILYLLENPEIRQRMGRASRELYLQKFTEEKMVERLAACFNTVLSSE